MIILRLKQHFWLLLEPTSHDLGQYGINVNMLSGGLLRKTDASSATPDQDV